MFAHYVVATGGDALTAAYRLQYDVTGRVANTFR
jgi:hypothetical protein